MDASLIKVEKNQMALRRAPHPSAPMSEMFTPMPLPKVLHTTTIATTKDRPPKPETDEDRGPTTSVPTRMVYVSAISIQAIT